MIRAESTTLVLIEIVGEARPFPRSRDDKGLVARLLTAQCDGVLPLAARGLSSGAGRYSALFWPNDAPKVRAWLTKQGIEIEEAQ